MPDQLSPEEGRVLGCLLEKEAATPEYYPLTLNALRNACNQSSSRNPVVSYGDGEVSLALATLREKGLVRVVYSPSNRAAKYRQVTDEAYGLDARGRAVVCLLLLRGPQTVGELRLRSDRLCAFESLEEVERLLEDMASAEDPLVVRLPRAPGQKESRFAELLTDPRGAGRDPEPTAAIWSPEPTAAEPIARAPGPGPNPPAATAAEPAVVPGPAPSTLDDRVGALEAEVSAVRAELEEMRTVLDALRSLLD